MTVDSLSVFSRVRLYTAIYPQGDVVDFTEDLSRISLKQKVSFPVLPLSQLSLKRLPTVNPLRYQSPIALVLGAKLGVPPGSIAQMICQESMAKSESKSESGSESGSEITFDHNDLGWITLTWDRCAVGRVMAQLCGDWAAHGWNRTARPFWLWQMTDRVRSLKAQLRSVYPVLDLALDPEQAPSLDWMTNWMTDMSEPIQDFLEALVIFFDRLSDGGAGSAEFSSQVVDLAVLRSLGDAFERMHRQVALFHPQLSRVDRDAAWCLLSWFQAILKISDEVDKEFL